MLSRSLIMSNIFELDVLRGRKIVENLFSFKSRKLAADLTDSSISLKAKSEGKLIYSLRFDSQWVLDGVSRQI